MEREISMEELRGLVECGMLTREEFDTIINRPCDVGTIKRKD